MPGKGVADIFFYEEPDSSPSESLMQQLGYRLEAITA